MAHRTGWGQALAYKIMEEQSIMGTSCEVKAPDTCQSMGLVRTKLHRTRNRVSTTRKDRDES